MVFALPGFINAYRIIFGTDNGWGDDLSPEQKVISANKNVTFMREFYETDAVIETGNGIKVCVLSLPQDVCQKIYKNNYMKVLKSAPFKPVNLKAAIAYTQKLYTTLQAAETKSTIIN